MLESRARELEVQDVRHSTFLGLLEYLYTDQVEVTLESALDLFVAADKVFFCCAETTEYLERALLTIISCSLGWRD